MTTNNRTVTIKMSRGLACRLMTLCTAVNTARALQGEDRLEWLMAVHDHIYEAVRKFDVAEGGDAK